MKRLLAITALSLLLVLFVYPSAFIYSKDTLPDRNDTRLIAYIIGQVQQNITDGQPLYYGTFFAPDNNTLTYSDPFITSAVMTLPFRALTTNPIQIFNIVFIIGFFLTVFSSFLLFDYLFKDPWITLLSVLLFNLSGFHLAYYPHIQMLLLWPLILSIYFFSRYLKENRSDYLFLFFAGVTLQMAESLFPAYLIFFSTVILYIVTRLTQNKFINDLKFIFIEGIAFYIAWAFLLYPYLELHFSLPEASRPIRDAAAFSLGIDQIFTMYHSWTVILLFLISAVWQILNPLRTTSYFQKAFTITFFFSLIMSLGPVLKIFGKNIRIFSLPIPLPYTLFYYLFPGFTGFRTPSRFIVLALLAAVILIGFWLKPLFEKLKTKTKLTLILIVFSSLLLEADFPLKAYPVNINMHPVYEQVRALPPDAIILELPIKLWTSPDHEIESIRSLYSLSHGHRRYNGFSGFATNRWIELTQKIEADGLTQESINALYSLGVTHVVENNSLRPLIDPNN